MPSVTVSARHFVMPPLCVCCLGPPGGGAIRASATRVSGKRRIRTQEHALAFPACARCAAHHDAEPDGGWYVVLAVLSLGVLVPLLLPLYLSRRASARALRTPTCPRSGPAVTLEGWQATDHRFWFAQPAAADAFLRGNLAAGKTAWSEGGAAGVLGPGVGANLSGAGTVLAVVVLAAVGVCTLSMIFGGQHPQSTATRGTGAPPPATVPTAASTPPAPSRAPSPASAPAGHHHSGRRQHP